MRRVQVVDRYVDHRLDADRERGFVDEIERRVIARRLVGILPGRRRADEKYTLGRCCAKCA
jgi:hypothetical protein